ncbi:MAG: PD-(D/E)XK nuclease family protein [Burkholderiales bacterium]
MPASESPPLAIPPASLLAAAASAIVENERERLPDLSHLTVLLPHLHAVPLLAQALGEAAQRPALLLPRLTTLPLWASDADPGLAVLPDSRREAMLYQALKSRNWLPDADLWALCAELRGLMDELTRCRIGLPQSYDEFLALLERAYRTRAGRPLQFEARLVHEMWFALGRSGDGAADRESAYALQLAARARQADGPLYSVGLDGLSPLEQAFLDAYAESWPVRRLDQAPATPPRRLLAAVWPAPDSPESVDLYSRALAARGEFAASPLAGRLELFGANGLEQEARAIDTQLRRWLLAGKQRIAVIAQDRLVARRARALLERAEVLVEDETGWTLSTAAASTAVRRWLDSLASGFYHLDLLDLLKSPYLLADWDAARRKASVYRLEQLLRRHSVVSRLERYLDLARRSEDGEDAVALLERLQAAQALFAPRQRPLAAWLQVLLDALELLGMRQGLAQDFAGQQLLQLFASLQRELAADDSRHSLAEWRAWLYRQLENSTFRDTGIDSPVVFTHLGNVALRHFDGVIVAGADSAHLPGEGGGCSFFNQAVRAELGLPSRLDELRRQERQLADLIDESASVFVTWQARRLAEPNLLSPWFERLQAFHRLAFGADLLARDFAGRLAASQVHSAAPDASIRPGPAPRPSLPSSRVPGGISASGYNSLLACPYQFFARHGLKLNEPDEVRESLEKKDYGEFVHRILERFHREHPSIVGLPRQALEAELHAITDRVFAEALQADYLSHGWALRWKSIVPAYLGWQTEREAAGWRVADREAAASRDIPLAGEHSLTLKGRLDRVDRSESGFAVLDYKTQRPEVLRKKLAQPGEDVQLPVYALLLDEPAVEAAFVSLEKDGVSAVPLEDGLEQLSEAVLARLQQLFEQLHAGAALPAQGIARVCDYCEMRGLCRKDYWNAD